MMGWLLDTLVWSGALLDRELAIAHELAHHRGRDLLANMLAQAVLALHWFNPLAWATNRSSTV